MNVYISHFLKYSIECNIVTVDNVTTLRWWGHLLKFPNSYSNKGTAHYSNLITQRIVTLS